MKFAIMSKNNFRHVFVTDREDVSRYLDALKEGFGKGVLTFSHQNREVRLETPEVVELTVETNVRKNKVHVNLSFAWPDEERPLVAPLPLDGRF
ncbi:MAG: amphi-Trp domain-containing protein [Deltaproteobacteria bacterium]|nr:amphi-Trp domain-containing protein [Deltaproteobacteria bacterium]